ncbi:MAG TPA: phosphatidate cytidylyltransferase [Deltaproteobacteria bacterium]|nr:phosphatidate cytidylyltransferase [Deltaproteobacteria bacterium]HPP80626.1 phosphatidate cytidylyltransferase [Deltaproteobacteria bacterium]
MTRILAALVLIVVLAVPAVFGPAWVLAILAAIVIPMCMHEFFRVAIGPDARILGWISIASSFPYVLFAYRGDPLACILTVGVACTALMAASLILYERSRLKAADLAYAMSGLLYPMALIGFWVLLRVAQDGRFWMIFGLVSVFASDVGAYYAGRSLGRRKIAPRLSPKKTVEGFIGGVFLAMILGYASSLVYSLASEAIGVDTLSRAYPWWVLVSMSACIAALDLAGDLTASLFKREFQIKDLGTLIPGHGGMLDRMDGIIPVGCLLYIASRVVT